MKTKRANNWYRAFAQPTTYLGVIAITIILSGAFFLEKNEYKSAYDNAIQRGANLTNLLAQHVSGIFDNADNQLLLLRQLYQSNPNSLNLAHWINYAGLNTSLEPKFAVIGPDGKIISSGDRAIPTTANIEKQDYFRFHLTSPNDNLFVSAPFVDRVSKKTEIILSRRLTASNGKFGGVMLASFDMLSLQNYFNSIALGDDVTISLIGYDGIIRARSGDNGDSKPDDYVSNNVYDQKLFQRYHESRSGDFWSGPDPAFNFDSIRRLISYRAIENLRLFAVVGVPETEVFKRASENARIGWSKAFFFTGIILVAISIAAARERKLIGTKGALFYQARHDALTGLANRQSFVHEIEIALSRLRTNDEVFSVFMLDLNRFKNINDSLGHAAGDALLKGTAKRLKSSLPSTDFLARLGGDEFAIIQRCDTKSQNDNAKWFGQSAAAVDLAERIVACLETPFEFEGKQLSISTSIGIALAQGVDADSSELMKRADLALYFAKSQGALSNFVFFDDEMAVKIKARQILEWELRSAISNNEFELHYQPIIDAKTRKVCSIEALVRWRHPQRGLIGAHEFLPVAEGSGLIVPISQWVLQQACVDAVTWPANITLVVNLSTTHLRKRNLVADVNYVLHRSGLPSQRLEIDVTESALFDGDGKILESLRQLKKRGITIALDDFGTGYSSLNNLTAFPFDKIKIDRSFISKMTRSPASAAVIAAVITLGRCLDILTTAEGVESEQEFQCLLASGVNFVQGYLFGPPRPAYELRFDDPHWRECNYVTGVG